MNKILFYRMLTENQKQTPEIYLTNELINIIQVDVVRT